MNVSNIGKISVNINNSSVDNIVNFPSFIYIYLGRQDHDECADGTHQCEQICLDGWNPLFSYTCDCEPGYLLNPPYQCVKRNAVLSLGEIIAISVGIGGGLLAFLIIVILAFFLYYYYSSYLHYLPKEIRWSFLNKLTHPWLWTFNGQKSKNSGYYMRSYPEDSEEWSRVENLIRILFDGGTLKPLEIIAIYNPVLTQSFINHWGIVVARRTNDAERFSQSTFPNQPKKEIVMNEFHVLKDKFVWNNKRKTKLAPIIPGLHGTDFVIAEKIAQTGFASLSSLDSGFYGKGIYFTTLICYTLPYCTTRPSPAVIISYLNPGNIYPVTEHHSSPESLLGTALQSGFNSHFVLAHINGIIYDLDHDKGRMCNEIVVGQESQILPAFIVRLDKNDCVREFRKWERESGTVETLNVTQEVSYDETRVREKNELEKKERERNDSERIVEL